MVSLCFTFFLVLALAYIWSMWQNTCRDIARDELFDLRDKWRDYWISKGLSLDSKEYANVRIMLNQYLRYTACFRLSGLLFCSLRVSKDTLEYLKKERDSLFYSENQEIKEEIDKIRMQAALAIQKYMLSTTILIFPLIIMVLVYILCIRINEIRQYIKSECESWSATRAETIECAVCMS